MSAHTVSTKVPSELRKGIEDIAAIEQRKPSSVVRLAIEAYVQNYFSLHPQFKADIAEAREAMGKGDVEDYAFG